MTIDKAITIPMYALFALLAPCVAAEDMVDPPSGVPENFKEVFDGVYSGGEPHGEETFNALAALGVRTIVSVDGLAPDVALAKKFGIRYVHIPIGYDQIEREAAAAIAAVLEKRPGPHYIHCHHGKHRGPAMAAIAMRLRTNCDDDAVRAWLGTAGVSEDYGGLWRDALAFRPEDVADVEVELHAVTQVSDLAGAMADVDRIWERLQKISEAGWKPLPDHPDVTPEREALMLYEGIREMGRQRYDGFDDPEFAKRLAASEAAGRELLEALRAPDPEAASAAAERLRKSCKDCHFDWRN